MFRNEVWHTPEYGCGLLQIVFSGGKEGQGGTGKTREKANSNQDLFIKKYFQ